MIEIRALPDRERVVLVYRGEILPEELAQAEGELRALLRAFAAPFDLIADISEAQPLSEAAVQGATRVAELIARAGLRTQLRVVGRSARTAVQFERIAKAVGDESRLAFSFGEAERLLDGPG